ncbi:MAG TPA: hypothetical protein VGM73_08835 [Candidatus Didemnitutus sp.]|jgi:hypothetical protein
MEFVAGPEQRITAIADAPTGVASAAMFSLTIPIHPTQRHRAKGSKSENHTMRETGLDRTQSGTPSLNHE